MKNIIYTLALIALLSSCHNKDCCAVVSVDININVQNADGESLLDPDTEDYLNSDSIKVYYVNEGKAELYNKPYADYPNGYDVISTNLGTYLRLFPNVEGNDENPMTLIQWDENSTDTIKCAVVNQKNDIYVGKVWLNEQTVYDSEKDKDGRWITIVK